MNKLKQHYNPQGGNDLQWFLGIRILRDREKRIIWLSQSSYIDKIINLAKSTQPDETPMSREELTKKTETLPLQYGHFITPPFQLHIVELLLHFVELPKKMFGNT